MNKSYACIVAGGHTRFGSYSQKDELGGRQDLFSLEQMMAQSIGEAFGNSVFSIDEVDAVWLGSCSPGAFANQELLAPLLLNQFPQLRFKACYQLTAACASGSAALHAAADAVESGQVKVALVVGAEKMSLKSTPDVAAILARCSHFPTEGARGVTFPQLFARLATAYQQEYRISDERFRMMLATVAAQNYRYGLKNPLAHFSAGSVVDKLALTEVANILALDDKANPWIAPPLRLHDCSPVSDGAVALLLVRADHPKLRAAQGAALLSRTVTTDYLQPEYRSQPYQLEAAAYAMDQCYKKAGINANRLDLIEVHDCFSSNQLLCLEAAGISAGGQAGEDYLAGRFADTSSVQVNLSGGLKAKGHPVGATGVSMHYFAYRQLTDNAVGQACQGAELAAVLNIGGSGVVNCASVLGRLQG